MARAHFWQYVQNTEGQPVTGAIIALYTDSTLSNVVNLYSNETGTSTIDYVTSNTEGFFEFWVGDLTETNGYSINTKFSLVVFNDTIGTKQIDNIILHFQTPRIYDEDLTSTWISSGTSGLVYMYDITHNLNTSYPIVQIWDNNKITTDIDCYSTSVSGITLSASYNPGTNIHVTIIGSDLT